MTDTNGAGDDLTPTRRRRRRTPEAAAPGEAIALLERPLDETADHRTLPQRPSEALGGLLTPGLAETEAPSTGRRSVRTVLKDAADFSELRRSPYGLAPLLILGGISFFQRFDTQAFSIAGPDIARDLNINVADIISIQAIVGFFVIFAAIYAGWLADRHRRVPFISIGTLVSGVFSAVTGRGRSFAGIATPRVIDDVADTAGSVPRFSLLADYYPPEVRGKAFAFLGTLAKSAGLLAPVAAGYAVQRFGWGTSFAIFATPLVVMAILAQIRLREPVRGYFERQAMGADEDVALEEEEPQSFGEAWRATWSVRTLRRITVANVFFGFTEAVGLYFAYFLAEKYGLSALERGIVFIPAVAAGLLGGFVGGALVDSFTRTNPSRVITVLGVFSLVLAPGVLLYVLQPPLPFLILAQSLIGFGGALVGPASSVVFAQVIPPQIRTQGLQLTALADIPGLLFGLPMAGYLFGQYGYTAVFLFSIPFAVVGSLILLSATGFFELDMRNAFASTMAADEWRRARAAGSSKLLVMRNVDVEYQGVQVLFGVDLDIEDGEIVALLGTNGAGKSTLLRALCGLQEASAGGIVFDGRDITHMPTHEIAARGVVQMPGGRGVFPGLTVRDNLLLGTWLTEDPADNQARVSEVMEIFPDLRERIDVRAGDLSGGQQQQLSLAQAFLAKPKLLLIDELSLGLAPQMVGRLIEIVKEINRRGVTVIVVEQSINVALTLADRAVFMEKGEVRFDGRTDDLLRRTDILRAVYVKGTSGSLGGATTSPNEARQRVAQLEEARPILEVEHLVKRFGGVTAVDDVSFALREGEVLGLIGPNGAGKTTVFELISGHQRADAGIVRFEGVDVTKLSPDARAQKKLIRRFQDARLFPSLTVYETLLVALEQRLEVRNAFLNAAQLPQARRAERRIRARADRLLELLDLGAYRDKFVRELSTGLRRIVDLACVLAAEPQVLLLDEPSSGIAQSEAEGLAPLLQQIRFETGCSILIIEHDMPLISAVSDELIAFDQGSLLLRGTPADVLADERVVESYLGTSEAAVNRSGSIS
jgi:branched-chain amino acid transport system ATP-binding protein